MDNRNLIITFNRDNIVVSINKEHSQAPAREREKKILLQFQGLFGRNACAQIA